MGSPSRNANLDLLRATAIGLVVVYHVVQMSPEPFPRLMQVVSYGRYGVDVFFALSGWLIGSLYWKEYARFGHVDMARFWGRRWLRTIPPYLVALALAYAAVAVERHEPFRWSYLVFVQNYYTRIPFFLVSWSLCIEEHFYLFVPCALAVLLARGASPQRVLPFFIGLTLVSPILRWLTWPNGSGPDFGSAEAATHLRLEGLMLGFLAAYLPFFQPAWWTRLTGGWWRLRLISAAALVLFVLLPAPWAYRVGFTVLDAACVGLLISFVNRPPGRLALSRVTAWIALTSYSVYLTHSLVLHAVLAGLARVPAAPRAAYFPLAVGAIATCGLVFWRMFEVTAIDLRERLARRREAALATMPALEG